ncbi:MAG TPA: aminotransferase class I/II-fold pyridoxal phosphate-dependent enzyme [Phototrophicaceae bacterium]|jgi:cystathionine beta-lyase/cystathionine gamma-synthase|nr:aminotransferase class I/II-fold pyridoxal phosphate-dependent enzyme [Phototrophicaceae bacterium]
MNKGPSTTGIHGMHDDDHHDANAHPVTYPIYQTAAFYVESNEAYARINQYGGDEYFYTRYDNPTLRNVSQKLAQLEHAEECLLFASGMTAITTTLMALLRSGDTIAASQSLYGGTQVFLRDVAPRYGINVVLLSNEQLYEVDQYAPQAKIVYFETPVNPRTDCVSIRRVVTAAKRIGALVVKDNTFASPINQNPLDFGVDLVLHSVTKYIGGHSDVTAGAVMGSRALIEPIFSARKVFGGIPSPHDAFLLDRSLKTLELRMQQHNASALKLAEFFEAESKVKQVLYPGLPSSPDYAVACEQMRGFSGVLCLTLASLDAAKAFCDNLKLVMNVAHLAGPETMVCIPVLTSHSMLNEEELRQAKIAPGMVRVSVGLENTEDLIVDFEQALVAKI